MEIDIMSVVRLIPVLIMGPWLCIFCWTFLNQFLSGDDLDTGSTSSLKARDLSPFNKKWDPIDRFIVALGAIQLMIVWPVFYITLLFGLAWHVRERNRRLLIAQRELCDN